MDTLMFLTGFMEYVLPFVAVSTMCAGFAIAVSALMSSRNNYAMKLLLMTCGLAVVVISIVT